MLVFPQKKWHTESRLGSFFGSEGAERQTVSATVDDREW